MSAQKAVEQGQAPVMKPPAEEKGEPGFCSAVCVSKDAMIKETKKPPLKTSDLFLTCNLPKRFEHPHWFNGYGCQVSKQHPFYRTTASEYGWYPPGWHTVPTVYHPIDQHFSTLLYKAGMFRDYSLNTGVDQVNVNY